MTALHPVIAAIGEIHLEGNITPHAWYRASALRLPNGKPNLAAITLLADLVYWYRPTIIRDEASGRITSVRQKFRADKLQKDYKKWGEQFGLTKNQTEDAVRFLRQAGLINTETRTIEVMGRLIGNVVFLEPIVEAIKAISSLVAPEPAPDDPSPLIKGEGSISTPPFDFIKEEGEDSSPAPCSLIKGDSPPLKSGNTYNTSQTTAHTPTTTTPAPAEAKSKPEASVVVDANEKLHTSQPTQATCGNLALAPRVQSVTAQACAPEPLRMVKGGADTELSRAGEVALATAPPSDHKAQRQALETVGVKEPVLSRLSAAHTIEQINAHIKAWRSGEYGQNVKVGRLISAIANNYQPSHSASNTPAEMEEERAKTRAREMETARQKKQEQEQIARRDAAYKALHDDSRADVLRRAHAKLGGRAVGKEQHPVWAGAFQGAIRCIMAEDEEQSL